ncbi:MAG: hypothetical protein P1V51_01430 [Deltaproteobacteria bacterium]|nr:hypothetical protein [Deltaproteobacteria bacterium]
MPGTGERRLLMLEFVTHERWVFDSRLYPLIKGGFEAYGQEARWLCFGAQISIVKVGEKEVLQLIDLPPEDLETLRRHLRELEPTHVLMSHPVTEATLEVLREAGEVALASVSDHSAPPGVVPLWRPESMVTEDLDALGMSDADKRLYEKLGGTLFNWMQSRTDWLLRWMGEDPATNPDFGKYFLGTFEPSFDVIMANERSRAYAPHLPLVGGVTCDHFRTVKDNPYFEGLDLSDCQHDHGCSYCTWYRGPTSDMHADPVEAAMVQLRRLVETGGEDGRHQGYIDLLDIRLFTQLERFAEQVCTLPLRPTTFCFEPRIDRLVQVEPALRKALPKLAEKGHGVLLFRMGAENLIEEENILFNKYVTLQQIDEGSRFLREFAAEFPDNFEFDPTWGYITCSPWTTLDMFETGIERAIERGFEPLGVWLYTPILFYRGSPITKLAESKGDILQTQFADLSLLYEASVNNVSFDTFLPWRFLDPRTGWAFALVVRFCAAAMRDKYSDSLFDGDALYERICGWEAEGLPLDRPDLFALEAIAAVRAASEAAGVDEAHPPELAPLAEEAKGPYRVKVEAALEAERRAWRTDASGEEAKEASADPASAGDPDPEADLDPALQAELRRARVLQRVAQAVREKLGPVVAGLEVLQALPVTGEASVALTITLEGQRYELRLDDPTSGRPCFFRTEHFLVSYVKETPLESQAHQRTVKSFLRAVDRVASRHAPYALPGSPA